MTLPALSSCSSPPAPYAPGRLGLSKRRSLRTSAAALSSADVALAAAALAASAAGAAAGALSLTCVPALAGAVGLGSLAGAARCSSFLTWALETVFSLGTGEGSDRFFRCPEV